MARPTKLPKFLEDPLWADVGKGATRRTMRNCHFRHEAFSILIKNGIENFKFLYDPAKEGTGVKFIRKTILTELGRIADEQRLLDCARQLCDAEPSTVDAIWWIRKVRKAYGSRDEVYKHSKIHSK